VVIFTAAVAWAQNSSPVEPPGLTVRSVKFETLNIVKPVGSVAGAPDSNPNRLPLPTDGSVVNLERTELRAYSMELTNDGPKVVKALAWDFIFADPATGAEQLRHSFANLQKIDPGQKKTVRFNTQLGPPKVVDAAALEKDPKARFRQSGQLQCVLFADGSTWQRPEATRKPCDHLREWIERHKDRRPLLEDLPFNP